MIGIWGESKDYIDFFSCFFNLGGTEMLRSFSRAPQRSSRGQRVLVLRVPFSAASLCRAGVLLG